MALNLTDSRQRMHIAAAADVCMQTMDRFWRTDGKGVRASSARRIREAIEVFEKKAKERAERT